jgi:hypothetical protein
LAWLQRSADSHNTYVLEVSADENIAPHTFEYKGAINITIVLRGVGGNRTIRLKSHGAVFRVNPNVTFILDNNITIHGHPGNWAASIDVYGGTFKMNGSIITGGSKCGVYLDDNGIFEMTGGTISGNSESGVWIKRGNFTMTAGIIAGNINSNVGGGVGVDGSSTFTMKGGTISGNTAKYGGGIWVGDMGNFIMNAGTITSNTAQEYGGGVYVIRNWYGNKTFAKTGGTITGYNSDQSNGNVVKDENGVIARRGHAIVYGKDGENRRKETTAGPEVKLSCERRNCSGGWDE